MPNTQTNALSVKITEIVDHLVSSSKDIPIIGISGPQGSGKSTALEQMIKNSNYNLVGLGLDDFYLTKLGRDNLALDKSPLFETRGPPGTHDLNLLNKTIAKLLLRETSSNCLLPQFDKLKDDRKSQDNWKHFEGRPDAIIIEGWLVGAMPPPQFSQSAPINEVELSDENNEWRHEQFKQLSGPYCELWDKIDYFIHIISPGFEAVKDWRLQQEATNRHINQIQLEKKHVDWVLSFVQYFERLTLSMHAGHKRPGAEIAIDLKRSIVG